MSRDNFVGKSAGGSQRRRRLAAVGIGVVVGAEIVREAGVTLVGEGIVAIPNFTDEQVRFLDERREIANRVRVMERVGGRSSRTASGGARIS